MGLPRLSLGLRKAFSVRSFGSIMRVATGFTCLLLMLLAAAVWMGLIPDRADTVMQARKLQVESLAVTYSGMLQLGEPEQIQPMLAEIFRRTPELMSAGIRDPTGKLTVEIGNHEALWTNREGQESTDTQIKVQITQKGEPLGQLELRFAPMASSGWRGIVQDNILQFFAFITVGSLVLYGLYVWAIMRSVMVATSLGAVPNRVRTSLNTLSEGLLILDKQQRIVLANKAFARMLGSTPKDVEGTNISTLPWIKLKNQDAVPYLWESPPAEGEAGTNSMLGLQGPNQRPETLSVNATSITGMDGAQRGIMLTFDNHTELEEKNEHLQQLTDQLTQSQDEIMEQNKKLELLATRDPLTGSFNRRAFMEKMEEHWAASLRYGHPVCCIMMDIDHFKKVNDTYGHAVGDEAIKHVATLLESGRRNTDIVARYGGEEFVVLLPHVGMNEAMIAAERLRKSIEKTACGSLLITVSMGVASSVGIKADSGNPPKSSALLQQADLALYAAKHRGRNQSCRWDELTDAERGEKQAAPAV